MKWYLRLIVAVLATAGFVTGWFSGSYYRDGQALRSLLYFLAAFPLSVSAFLVWLYFTPSLERKEK